jgi:hypothetical protein
MRIEAEGTAAGPPGCQTEVLRLRLYATSRKVAGYRPDEVIDID